MQRTKMNRRNQFGCAARLVVGIALGTMPTLPVSAASYQFINIVDDSGPFDSGQFAGATINSNGVVAFKGAREGVHGIYRGSGGPIDTIADTAGAFSGVGFSASINDSGVVAFNADLDAGGSGIFIGSGGSTTPIVESSGPFLLFDPPAINNSNMVAFGAILDDGNQGIFRSDDGDLTTIAELGGTLSFIGFGTLAVNNGGTVAFSAFRRLLPGGGGLSTGSGVFTGDGGPIDTAAFVVSAGGFFETPSINDSETLTFVRSFNTGERTIFVYSGGLATPFVTASGSGPFGGVDYPQINSAGDVAFRGYVFQPVEGYGIFSGPDPVADEVIQTGDPLFGSTVSFVDLSFGRRLNDRGEIVFGYGLANGIAGIAVARVFLPGDYNQDGTVDAADYTLWQDNLGAPAGTLPNEVDGGPIGQPQYDTWKANFGNTPGSGAGATVDSLSSAFEAIPEPASILSAVFTSLLVSLVRPCRIARSLLAAALADLRHFQA